MLTTQAYNLLLMGNLNLIIKYYTINPRLDRRQAHSQRSIQIISFKTEILVIFTMTSHKTVKNRICETVPSIKWAT